MLFGNSASPYEPTVNEIMLISRLGLDIAEIVIEPPFAEAQVLLSNADEIKSALRKSNLKAYGHAPHFISLGSGEVIERAGSVLTVQYAIDASTALGIEKLVVHASNPGYPMMPPKERARFRERMAEMFSFLNDYAAKKKVQILAENVFEPGADEFFSFLKMVDGLKMAFDAGHAFLMGGMGNVKKFLDNAEFIEHMHLHDNHGRGDEHLALGKGKIDLSRLLACLKKSGYDKSITFEIFSGNREQGVKKSVEIVKKGLGLDMSSR